jgi:hypothetical protein
MAQQHLNLGPRAGPSLSAPKNRATNSSSKTWAPQDVTRCGKLGPLQRVCSGETGDDVEVIFSVVSGFDGESPDQALRGLGFVRAFAFAESTRFECDGLLKPGGLTIGGAGDPDPASFESLMAAGLVAQALAELELRDRRSRTMPASVSHRDAAVAKAVLELFRESESRDDVNGAEFEVPLPHEAQPSDDPTQWMSYVQAMPDIAHRPTLRVLVTVERATPAAHHQRQRRAACSRVPQ